jgi:outer membrane receptor protein involved in Fe transport
LNKFHFFIVLVVLLIALDPVAAQHLCKIAGAVRDHASPLEFVTVTLAKESDTAKIISYTATDSSGSFLLEHLDTGVYVVGFSFIGYHPITKRLSLTDPSQVLSLDPVLLNENTNLLQTVMITSTKKLIEKIPEGFIINTASNLTATGGTATDLLKNTPTVSVDADGAITLRGKTPMILVNGRNSNLGNPDQIPASSIESIEILTNPSAKYEANAESGIINIILKKNKQNGTNGAFAVGTGVGAKDRENSSLLFNHKTKKWNLGIGYDNRFAGRTRGIDASRTNFFIPESYLLDQKRNDHRREQLQNLKTNIDYTLDAKNTISLEAIGSIEGQDNFEDLISLLRKQNNAFNSNTDRYSAEIERTKAVELSMDYRRKFVDIKKSLTANFSSSSDFDRQNTDITSQALNASGGIIGNPLLERTHSYENSHVLNVKVDYAVPLLSNVELETGYKSTWRSIRADYMSAAKIDGTYQVNAGATNIFDFNEDIHAAYAMIHGMVPGHDKSKWKYSIGMRAEAVLNQGSTVNSTTSFKNQYIKLFPTTSISYLVSSDASLKMSYGKRINRPWLGLLNPFIDITDALNPHSGNPELKPEIIHNIELGYNKEWTEISYTSNLFYRHALNTIRPFYMLLPNGANLNMPVNVGNGVTYGLEQMADAKISNMFHVNASVTIFRQHLDGIIDNADIVKDAFGWNGKLINNVALGDASKLQIIGNYTGPIVTPQGRRLEQYFVDLGYQYKLGKGYARLGLTIVDVFNTLKSSVINNTPEFSNYRTSKADTRAIMVTFAYSFKAAFKDKLLENQFEKE